MASNAIDLNEDVMGCEDNYYRFVISFWRITQGWFDLGITLGTVVLTFLAGFTSLANLSTKTQSTMGISTMIVGGIVTSCQIFKTYATHAVTARKLALRETIMDSHSSA